MGRRPCCAKEGLNRGAWTAQEDKILSNYINIHGEGKWRDLPQRAGLKRCGKSCRLRWLNYLRPDIKRGNISVEEEELIIKLHKLLGNRWSLIAGRLPGRTDNEIKNYWNTNLSKRMHGHKTQNSMKNQNKLIRDKGSMEDSCKPVTRSEPHKVIRTKAVRCTKVVIPQPLDPNQMLNKNEALTRENHDSPSTSLLVDQDDSSNFLSDFDIGDLFISEVLNSECHREGGENDIGGGYGGDGMIISASSGFPPCEEDALQSNSTNEIIMLEVESWKGSDQLLQSIEAFEIKRLASFFDSEEDWIT